MRLSHVLICLAALMVMLAILPFAAFPFLAGLLDDQFYGVNSAPVEKSWAPSSAPRIVVESANGAITIKPSTDGRISASVVKNTRCKNSSQEVAEDAVRFVHVEMVQDGDTIRVLTRPTADLPKDEYARTGTYIEVSTSIEIRVPDGARLDLTTGCGSIWVVGKPEEIHAKNQDGIILFELDAARGATDAPARLKLEGYNGEAEAGFDGKAYSYKGVVKRVH